MNDLLSHLKPKEIEQFYHDWTFWGRRDQQLPKSDWNKWLILAGRGWGKALDIRTKVPTPTKSGWTRLEYIKAGDTVYDEFGNETKVITAHDIFTPDYTYEITFKTFVKNRVKILACKDHLWQVEDAHTKVSIIVSTEALYKLLQEGYTYRIPLRLNDSVLYHNVLNIELAPACPVRCLTVDSPSRLFLVTEYLIPTHNTRTGAETVKMWKNQGAKRMGIIGKTPGDVRDIMIEGESGIIATSPSWDKPEYHVSKACVTWANGAICQIRSGADPEKLRGVQNEKLWCDELFAWDYPEETWDQAMMGLRLGSNPQVIITTTPKPTKLIRRIMNDPSTHMTRGSTYDNRTNLPDSYFKNVLNAYEGTRLGRQELDGDVLFDNPDALWNTDMLDRNRIKALTENLIRIVVAIDPATTNNAKSDETGIIVAGINKAKMGFLLEDLSCKASPDTWARIAVQAYKRWKADRIVAETNQGGDMVRTIIRSVSPTAAYKGIHATKGKYTRAEPISALYEQNKVKHVGCFQKLEEELTEWTPGADSPNRLDAVVWAFTELMLVGDRYSGTIDLSGNGDLTKTNRWGIVK